MLVTSGAIARGMRLLDLAERPRAMDELQACSAVGQGDLFQAYRERLEAGGTKAAQVLLTLSDVSERSHYLNARQALERLLAWGLVPVINENDTTSTDEITFGDNDFLAALVAALLGARLLVLLTNTDGVFTADPRTDPGAELVRADRRRRGARADRDRRVLAARPRRHAEQDRLGPDRQRVGRAGGDLQRDAGRGARRGGGRGRGRDALHGAGRGPPLALQAVAQICEAADAASVLVDAGAARAAAGERVEPACGRRRPTSTGASRPATPSG